MSQLIVDAGAFTMALNVLRRAGKDEVADELEKACETVPDEIKQLNQQVDELREHLKELNKHLSNAMMSCGMPLSPEKKLARMVDIIVEDMPVVAPINLVPDIEELSI